MLTERSSADDEERAENEDSITRHRYGSAWMANGLDIGFGAHSPITRQGAGFIDSSAG